MPGTYRGRCCFGQSGQENLSYRRDIQAKGKDHARPEKKWQKCMLSRRKSMCKDSEESPDNLSSNFHELHPILMAPPQAKSPYSLSLPSPFPK